MYILTAHHVVQDYIHIKVYFDEVLTQPLQAILVGSNPQMDVALLQIAYLKELEQTDVPDVGLAYNDAPDADSLLDAS